jgi:FtsH-binding integral membrane protein
MADYQTIRTAGVGTRTAQIDEGLRAHMNKVYGLMSVGMLLTGAVAWAVAGLSVSSAAVDGAVQIGVDRYLTAFGAAIYTSPLKWVIILAPLVMVFGFGAILNRLSAVGAQLYFYVFAALIGLSLSSIFLVYTGASIAQTFLVTAIAFASLSLYGYTTKKDLSGLGTFLMMGVIGLVVAMIVNIFLASSALTFAISAIGVLLFAGLTAYDTQNIKNTYLQHAQSGDSEWLGKAAIMGALQLYLDFINLFTFLLHFLGNRE